MSYICYQIHFYYFNYYYYYLSNVNILEVNAERAYYRNVLNQTR